MDLENIVLLMAIGAVMVIAGVTYAKPSPKLTASTECIQCKIG